MTQQRNVGPKWTKKVGVARQGCWGRDRSQESLYKASGIAGGIGTAVAQNAQETKECTDASMKN